MSVAIASTAFPNVFLRLDGRGFTQFAEMGSGHVNCQFGAGPSEQFKLIAQSNGSVAIESAAFPNVFLRLDGRGFTQFAEMGGGHVNCQFGAGPSEQFTMVTDPTGMVTFESKAFPGVYLRLDGRGFTQFAEMGGGYVNCQFGAGPSEKFRLVDSLVYTIGPEIRSSSRSRPRSIGSMVAIPDTPAPANVIVKALNILLMPPTRTSTSRGRCFLDIYSRVGNHFIQRASSPVAIDFSKSVIQTVPTEPLLMFAGDYCGLRNESGTLFVSWTDGPTYGMWLGVDRLSGDPISWVTMASCGWNIVAEKGEFYRSAKTAPVSPDVVAIALAPIVKLHPKEIHLPCSVGWFLNRCQLVRGAGELSSFSYSPVDLTDTMSVINSGPMTAESLKSASSNTQFGGGEIDDISLLPLPAAPNQSAILHEPKTPWDCFRPVVLPAPRFYEYQFQTLLGEARPDQNNEIRTEAYARIATANDYYLISYFCFYAYNGGLGPSASWEAEPLGPCSGFGQHIGDWTRITAKVKINQFYVSLLSVEFEAHGDSTTVKGPGYEFQNLLASDLKPLIAYAAWHSHEMYPTAGGRQWRSETYYTANDYTADDGPRWITSANLRFISDHGPAWVFYNGLWGANITVWGIASQKYLKNGPQGPAFHYYWTSVDKDQNQLISQWHPILSEPVPPSHQE